MGEAKKRGTYEQCKEAAVKRQEALAEIQRCTAKADFIRVPNKALQLAIIETILLSGGGKPWLKEKE